MYVIRSDKTQQLYVGFTDSPEDRLETHNRGGNTSTRAAKPWKLIYLEGYLDKQDALKREAFLKSGSGHIFLRKQLRHYLSSSG